MGHGEKEEGKVIRFIYLNPWLNFKLKLGGKRFSKVIMIDH